MSWGDEKLSRKDTPQGGLGGGAPQSPEATVVNICWFELESKPLGDAIPWEVARGLVFVVTSEFLHSLRLFTEAVQ